MVFRTLLTAIAVFGLVFSGCGKKPKQAQNQNVQIPTVATTPAAPAADTTAKKDSMDVFNEYYKDSKEPGAKAKKISKTFSVNEENQTPESYTPEFSDNGRYVVQIAASSSQAAADELTASIKGKGYPAYVTEVQNPTPVLQGTYYRVRIGGFSTLADAKAFGENILQPANYDYWVDLKSNESISSGTYSAPPSITPYPSSTEPAYTPAYTPATVTEPAAATTPAYTPAEQNWSTSSPSTGTETTTGSTWSTGATTGATTPPAAETPSTTPSSSGGTGTWGETGWKADSSSK